MRAPYRLPAPPPPETYESPRARRLSPIVHALVARALVMLLCLLGLAGVGSAGQACTTQDAKTAANVAVTVAQNVCQEEAQQPDAADWVQVACQAANVAGGIVHVLLPRAQWNALAHPTSSPAPCPSPCPDGGGGKAPAFDPGPGK